LDSIFSLPGSDKMDGIASVGLGELRRAATQGLLEEGTMLGVKSRYSTGVDTSRG